MRLHKTIPAGILTVSAASFAIGTAAAPVEADPLYRDTIVAQNPLAYWRFNDGPLDHADPIAAEVGAGISSAKNAGGVIEGVAGPDLPGFGADNTAFDYDNSPSAITYDLTGGALSSDAGSVSYWFKRDSEEGGTSVLFFGTDRTDNVDGFADNTLHTWMTAGGRTGFFLDGVRAETTADAEGNYQWLYSDNEWHQAVATWDRATGTINYYLDGGEGGPLASSQTLTATGATWDSFDLTTDRFGKAKYSTSRFYPGQADELAVWDRPLTEAEVLAQYTAAVVPEPASLSLLGLAGLGLLRRRRA